METQKSIIFKILGKSEDTIPIFKIENTRQLKFKRLLLLIYKTTKYHNISFSLISDSSGSTSYFYHFETEEVVSEIEFGSRY